MTIQAARNSKESPVVDVILATTGRSPRLAGVLQAILDQSIQVNSVYVIWNSLAEPNELKAFETNPKVVVLIKPEVNGAASAYNYGIKTSIEGGSNFICLAADDDMWHFEKIAKQMKHITESKVVFTSATFVNEYHEFKRPKDIFPRDKSPLEVFYAKKSIFSYSNYYLPISSVMFPAVAAKHLFNEKLIVREDIEWLERLHANGFEIMQLPDALINVASDYFKASKRESSSDIQKFLEIVESDTTKRNFLLYTLPRSSVLAGDLKKLLELHKFLKSSIKLNLRNIMELHLQTIVCFLILKSRRNRFISYIVMFRARGNK